MNISCVIPTHGRPELLRIALESVLNQTLPPAEILTIDDLGDADTAEVVKSVAASSVVPVELVRNDIHPGACGSRNLGASLARHEHIAFLDDDDVWYPTYLERVVERFAASDAGAVIGGLLRRDLDGTLRTLWTREGLTPDTLFDYPSYMTGSNLTITKNAFERAGRFDPDVPVWNDFDLFIRIVQRSIPYAVIPEVLVEWREHAGERITRSSLRRAEGFEIFVRKHRSELPDSLRKELLATALGIRRRYTSGLLAKSGLAFRLARVLGFGEAARRITRRALSART